VENLDDGFISIYVNETFARGFWCNKDLEILSLHNYTIVPCL
jgi:hypothetical protein